MICSVGGRFRDREWLGRDRLRRKPSYKVVWDATNCVCCYVWSTLCRPPGTALPGCTWPGCGDTKRCKSASCRRVASHTAPTDNSVEGWGNEPVKRVR